MKWNLIFTSFDNFFIKWSIASLIDFIGGSELLRIIHRFNISNRLIKGFSSLRRLTYWNGLFHSDVLAVFPLRETSLWPNAFFLDHKFRWSYFFLFYKSFPVWVSLCIILHMTKPIIRLIKCFVFLDLPRSELISTCLRSFLSKIILNLHHSLLIHQPLSCREVINLILCWIVVFNVILLRILIFFIISLVLICVGSPFFRRFAAFPWDFFLFRLNLWKHVLTVIHFFC